MSKLHSNPGKWIAPQESREILDTAKTSRVRDSNTLPPGETVLFALVFGIWKTPTEFRKASFHLSGTNFWHSFRLQTKMFSYEACSTETLIGKKSYECKDAFMKGTQLKIHSVIKPFSTSDVASDIYITRSLTSLTISRISGNQLMRLSRFSTSKAGFLYAILQLTFPFTQLW